MWQHQEQTPELGRQLSLRRAGTPVSLRMPWPGAEDLDPKIRIPFREITLHKVIGKGTFKTVYRGSWNNTAVAVVAMRRGGLVAEARLLQRLSIHPNLVQLYRWSTDDGGNEYLVMELLQLGSLDAVLRSIGRQLLTQTKMTIVEQVVSACLELSHEGLVHGDLAARNLLVKSLEPPHVKLADFGLARPVSQDPATATLAPGGGSPTAAAAGATQLALQPALQPAQQQQQQRPAGPYAFIVPARWAAPEVLAGAPPSEAADVWSFAVTCWEVFANGAEPYAHLSNSQILPALKSGYRLERPRGCPLELWELVTRCWAADPRVRPRFAEIATTLRSWREAYVSSRLAGASGGPGASAIRSAGGGEAAAAAAAVGGGAPVAAEFAAGGGAGAAGAAGAPAAPGAPAPAAAAAASAGAVGQAAQVSPSDRADARAAGGTHGDGGDAQGGRGSRGASGYAHGHHRHAGPSALSPALRRGVSGPISSNPTNGGVTGTVLATHLSFDINDPPITPAYTSGSSIAIPSRAESREQPFALALLGPAAEARASEAPGVAGAPARAIREGGGGAGAGSGGAVAAGQPLGYTVGGAGAGAGAAAAIAALSRSRLSPHHHLQGPRGGGAGVSSGSALRMSPGGHGGGSGGGHSAGSVLRSSGGLNVLEAQMERRRRLRRVATSVGVSLGQYTGSPRQAAAERATGTPSPAGSPGDQALQRAAALPPPLDRDTVVLQLQPVALAGSLTSTQTPSTVAGASFFNDSAGIPSISNPSNPSNDGAEADRDRQRGSGGSGSTSTAVAAAVAARGSGGAEASASGGSGDAGIGTRAGAGAGADLSVGVSRAAAQAHGLGQGLGQALGPFLPLPPALPLPPRQQGPVQPSPGSAAVRAAHHSPYVRISELAPEPSLAFANLSSRVSEHTPPWVSAPPGPPASALGTPRRLSAAAPAGSEAASPFPSAAAPSGPSDDLSLRVMLNMPAVAMSRPLFLVGSAAAASVSALGAAGAGGSSVSNSSRPSLAGLPIGMVGGESERCSVTGGSRTMSASGSTATVAALAAAPAESVVRARLLLRRESASMGAGAAAAAAAVGADVAAAAEAAAVAAVTVGPGTDGRAGEPAGPAQATDPAVNSTAAAAATARLPEEAVPSSQWPPGVAASAPEGIPEGLVLASPAEGAPDPSHLWSSPFTTSGRAAGQGAVSAEPRPRTMGGVRAGDGAAGAASSSGRAPFRRQHSQEPLHTVAAPAAPSPAAGAHAHQLQQHRVVSALGAPARRQRRGSNGSRASGSQRCEPVRSSQQGSPLGSAASSRGGLGSVAPSRLMLTSQSLPPGSPQSGVDGSRASNPMSPADSMRSAGLSLHSTWSAHSGGGGRGGGGGGDGARAAATGGGNGGGCSDGGGGGAQAGVSPSPVRRAPAGRANASTMTPASWARTSAGRSGGGGSAGGAAAGAATSSSPSAPSVPQASSGELPNTGEGTHTRTSVSNGLVSLPDSNIEARPRSTHDDFRSSAVIAGELLGGRVGIMDTAENGHIGRSSSTAGAHSSSTGGAGLVYADGAFMASSGDRPSLGPRSLTGQAGPLPLHSARATAAFVGAAAALAPQPHPLMEVLRELPESASTSTMVNITMEQAPLEICPVGSGDAVGGGASAVGGAAAGGRPAAPRLVPQRALMVTHGFEEYATAAAAAALQTPAVSTEASGGNTQPLSRGSGGRGSAGGQLLLVQPVWNVRVSALMSSSHAQDTTVGTTPTAATGPRRQASGLWLASGEAPPGAAAAAVSSMAGGASPSSIFESTQDEIVAERQAIYDYLQTRQLRDLQEERDW